MDKTHKVAIVTGGSRGIGLSIANQLVNDAYRVIICSRSEVEINSVVREIKKTGKEIYGIKADISKYLECKKLISFVMGSFGKINVLVNNAGIYGPIGVLESNSVAEWRKTFDTNLFGTMYCTRLVIPMMKKANEGKIINLCGGGVGGQSSLPRFSAYFTSKVAIAGFTEVIASELSEYNIQVFCIAPGAVNSRLTDYLLENGPNKAGEEMYEKSVKQKESGGDSPSLAANLVSFLVTPKANPFSGGLLSAKWDDLKKATKEKSKLKNMFKLRRIDNKIFYE